MDDFYKINLTDFLLAVNEPIIQVNHHYYRHEHHDSLVIDTRKNYFHWNSQNVSGGVIQYLMAVKGMSKAKALAYVYETTKDTPLKSQQPSNRPKQPFRYNPTSEIKVDSFPYLEKRGICPQLIQILYNQDLIAYNRHDQVVFKWYDKAQFVGCSLQGTTPLPPHLQKKYTRSFLKQIHVNSLEHWGFNVNIGTPKKLLVFESPIDLISYIQYDKQAVANSKCVSLEGLKKTTLLHFISKESERYTFEKVTLCVDNDSSGRTFIKEFDAYQHFDTHLPTQKDWNEQLLSKQSHRSIPLER